MPEFDIEAFVRERNEALLSLDEAKIRAYMLKYNGDSGPKDPYVFWCGTHKAIAACLGLPLDFRKKSKEWLLLRGMRSMDDGDLS